MSIPFNILSHQSVGEIRFGMSPVEVRNSLKVTYESFKRTSKSVFPCDYFSELECFVYYNTDGEAEAVEFAEPAKPILNGHNLLGLGFSDLVKIIRLYDPNLDVETDGFTSLALGVSAYAPGAGDEPLEPAESIVVFVEGYYD